jgi:hypothetical protein
VALPNSSVIVLVLEAGAMMAISWKVLVGSVGAIRFNTVLGVSDRVPLVISIVAPPTPVVTEWLKVRFPVKIYSPVRTALFNVTLPL